LLVEPRVGVESEAVELCPYPGDAIVGVRAPPPEGGLGVALSSDMVSRAPVLTGGAVAVASRVESRRALGDGAAGGSVLDPGLWWSRGLVLVSSSPGVAPCSLVYDKPYMAGESEEECRQEEKVTSRELSTRRWACGM
jgi:hypothetical protein